MADLYGYMHPVFENGSSNVKITLRSIDGTISAGGRFKYIAPEIDADYNSLVKALNDAIDKEAELTNNKFVTDERNSFSITQNLDYDEIMKTIQTTLDNIINSHSDEDFKNNYQPKITQVIEKYLGKGKKISMASRDQVEQLSLISEDLKDI